MVVETVYVYMYSVISITNSHTAWTILHGISYLVLYGTVQQKKHGLYIVFDPFV